MESYLDIFGTSILSAASGCLFLLIHHTDWMDGIVSRWRSEECCIGTISFWFSLAYIFLKYERILVTMDDGLYLPSISIYLYLPYLLYLYVLWTQYVNKELISKSPTDLGSWLYIY